jgi:hypothetical protein
MGLATKMSKGTAAKIDETGKGTEWEKIAKHKPPSTIGVIDQVLDAGKVTMGYFRPSMLFGCDRQNVFHYQSTGGAPMRRTPQRQGNQLLRILDNGTAIHEVMQRYLGTHPDVWFAPESKVLVNLDGAIVRGSCDGVLIRRSDGYRWGVEIKSINAKGFKELEEPKPEHVLQASLYARMQGLWWITIVYWNKDSQALKEYPVEYDPAIWKSTKARVKALHTYVVEGELPEYDSKSCDPAWCGFVDHCRETGAPV